LIGSSTPFPAQRCTKQARNGVSYFAQTPREKKCNLTVSRTLSQSVRSQFSLLNPNRLTEELPMAMTMMGDIQLQANREAVWAKLNDPAVLKSCIPGCEQLDMLSDSEFQAVATVKVGPVKARWKGKVRLSDFDPPNS
jgi:hypothetical protein